MMIQPKTKKELIEIISGIIEKEGNKADLGYIDTSLITDMSKLFLDSEFNGSIWKWDTSKVKNMAFMFAGSQFNGYIGGWNTGYEIWNSFFIPLMSL